MGIGFLTLSLVDSFESYLVGSLEGYLVGSLEGYLEGYLEDYLVGSLEDYLVGSLLGFSSGSLSNERGVSSLYLKLIFDFGFYSEEDESCSGSDVSIRILNLFDSKE
jgi:hypothetical protein